MDNNLTLIKGIHPGLILERELKKRKLAKGKFANSIHEYPQTIVAIIKGKRRMNPALSLKIEEVLQFEEGFLMTLQVFYDIEQEKKRQSMNYHPDFSKIREVVFWDTDIKRIDWRKNKSAVINRIFERGNEQEYAEIIRFYGKNIVLTELESNENLSPLAVQNMQKYLANR